MLHPCVHFMSGLPRSGSTLLAALLQQNPAVLKAGHISPVAPMMLKLSSVMIEGESQTEFNNESSSRILRGVLFNYYGEHDSPKTNPSSMIIDNSRLWCTRLGLINSLFPSSKIICCVRDPVWIIDSFEHIIQKNPLLSSKIIPIEQRGNLHSRVDALLSAQGALGFCWRAFNEAFYSNFAHNLIVVDYDSLVHQPQKTMNILERKLNLPFWDYDFNNINFEEPIKFDENLNSPGLHKVKNKIEVPHRRPILPPDIIAKLTGGTFWRDPKKNPGGAFVIS
ncbi:sulfotransferase [Acetobacter syzygii]|nr:sulfotransferase [Acetobacter syzygii]